MHDGLCLSYIAKSLVTDQLAYFCILYRDVQDSNLASPIITINLKKKEKQKNKTKQNKTKIKVHPYLIKFHKIK